MKSGAGPVYDGDFPRQWKLTKLLSESSPGLTAMELAAALGVTDRTIKRDLAVLRAVEIPLVETVESRGAKRYCIEIDQTRIPRLNFEEVAALWLGRRFLDPLAGTTLWRAALQAFKKLEQIFPPSARDFLNKMATSIHQTAIGTSDYTQLSDWIDCLLFAIDERRETTIEYHSLKSEAPRSLVINPLGLIYHEGVIYLVAIAKEHNEIRHYKIDRLSGVEPSEQQFTPPERFNLKQHLSGTLGVYGVDQNQPLRTVRIRFAVAAARYIQEHKWHESQTLEPMPDGTVICTLQLASLVEVQSWILSFGPRAEALEPPELRMAIQDDLRHLQEVYAR